MEEGKLFERYGYFSKQLKLLNNFNFHINPTLDELLLTKSMVQTAYRDMKEIKFDGTVVDYLCFIASEFFLRDWKISCENTFKEKNTEKLLEILNNKCRESEAAKNMLRLFLKDPAYFFNSEYYFVKNESLEPRVFEIIANLRYFFYIDKKVRNSKR